MEAIIAIATAFVGFRPADPFQGCTCFSPPSLSFQFIITKKNNHLPLRDNRRFSVRTGHSLSSKRLQTGMAAACV